jgi:hypothetical protein
MFSCYRLTLALGFTLGVASSHRASAQGADRWSGDISLGGAAVKGGDFLNNGHAAVRLSATDRVLQGGRFAIDAQVGYDWLGRFGLLGAASDLTCVVDTPGGRCRPPYPDVTGPSVSVGLGYTPVPRVETRIGVGGAAYSVDGTRVGAAVGQLDAAVFPAAHIGLIFGARFAAIPRYRHDRLTVLPVLFGLRVR